MKWVFTIRLYEKVFSKPACLVKRECFRRHAALFLTSDVLKIQICGKKYDSSVIDRQDSYAAGSLFCFFFPLP